MTRLIVIRGNSGSGKTTLAHRVRLALLEASDATGVAVIEQDYFRRIVLKELESQGSNACDLIELAARFALERGYVVILEGILSAQKYGPMVRSLLESTESVAFYLDVPFEETLRRHATKPNAHDFGEAAMRDWFLEHDVLGIPGEVIVGGNLDLDQTVELVLGQTDIRHPGRP